MASKNDTSSGAALRHLRLMAGLTLDQVAEGAKTSTAYLSKVETGKLFPTDEYVATIAAYCSGRVLAK